MEHLLQDIRHAVRQLVRSPAFTMVAGLTLALGIGANSAVFTMANAILARPLQGIGAVDRLVWLTPLSARAGRPTNLSYPDFLLYRAESRVFSGLAAMFDTDLALSTGGEPERVRAQLVSGNYFSLLRVPIGVGRGFFPEEDRAPGASPVAVISHDLWMRRFGGDPGAIGRAIVLNGATFTIVGIAPERFNGPAHSLWHDVWVPMMMASRALPQQPTLLAERDSFWLKAIGRLEPGVTAEVADAAVSRVSAQIASLDSSGHQGVSARVFAVRSGVPPGSARDVYPVATLGAAVTLLVLLIACANVSNLLLGRAVSRRREMGVRLTLGASRGRVVRQLLTESLLLALIASAVGFVLAAWATDFLAATIPAPLDLSPDRHILAFTVAIALGTTVLFGLVPALHATRSSVTSALTGGGAGQSGRRSRLQSGFVVAQISLSLVLLATAGLFLSSLHEMNKLDVGFDATNHVLGVSFDLGLAGYTPDRSTRFLDRLRESAAAEPDVESVSFTDRVPLGDRMRGADVAVESTAQRPGSALSGPIGVDAVQSSVRPEFFRTIGIPLVRGRDFTMGDTPGAPAVAIVSQHLAERAWPGIDPIGRRVSVSGPKGPFYTVVGVVREALITGPAARPSGVVYLPQRQHAERMDMTLLVRVGSSRIGGGDAGRLAPALRKAIRGFDPNLAVFRVQTFAQYRSDGLSESRVGTALLSVFGVLALVLASVGIYSVMSFSIGQRTREIGVRVALGARPGQVVALFLGEGFRLTATGVAIGLPLSVGVGKLLRSEFFAVTTADAAVVAAVSVVLASTALVACWMPARRGARADPAAALRHE